MPYPEHMSIPALPSIDQGKVICRFAQTSLDSTDPDELAELVPVVGNVLLQPLDGQGAMVGETFVFDKAFTVPLVNGIMSTRDGQPFVWLRVGNWRATFQLTGVTMAPRDFVVTVANDDANPLNILLGAPPAGPIITPSQFTMLDTRLLAVESNPDMADLEDGLNTQAYAGGVYKSWSYNNVNDRIWHSVPPTPQSGEPPEVQGLSAGGWDMTGKGGFYMMRIEADVWWVDTPPAGMDTRMGFALYRGNGTIIYIDSSFFPARGGDNLGNQGPYWLEKTLWIQIDDADGVLDWNFSIASVGGTGSPSYPDATHTAQPRIGISFQRMAGWPQNLV